MEMNLKNYANNSSHGICLTNTTNSMTNLRPDIAEDTTVASVTNH